MMSDMDNGCLYMSKTQSSQCMPMLLQQVNGGVKWGKPIYLVRTIAPWGVINQDYNTAGPAGWSMLLCILRGSKMNSGSEVSSKSMPYLIDFKSVLVIKNPDNVKSLDGENPTY